MAQRSQVCVLRSSCGCWPCALPEAFRPLLCSVEEHRQDDATARRNTGRAWHSAGFGSARQPSLQLAGGLWLGQLEPGASRCRERSASMGPVWERLVRTGRRPSNPAWFDSDSTRRDSSAARVLPTKARVDQLRRRASGCGLLPILYCKFQPPCPAPLRAPEATTHGWDRAPRAAEDCLGLSPLLLSKADSTVGTVPERGLRPSGASTSGNPD